MFKNLHDLDHMLTRIKTKEDIYGKLIAMYHRANTTRLRAMIMSKIMSVSDDVTLSKKEWCNVFFNKSPYGVRVLGDNLRNSSSSELIVKGDSESAIERELSKKVNLENFNEYLVNLTAREAYNHVKRGGLSHSDQRSREVLNSLKEAVDLELKAIKQPHGWTKQMGLGVISPKSMWLYATALPKLLYINNDNQFKSIDSTRAWNGILFGRSDSYSSHFVPKTWIMGDNHVAYPVSHAKALNMVVRLPIPRSQTTEIAGRINDISISYSHSIGYYDSTKYSVTDRVLVTANDYVSTEHGNASRDLCTFVQRHNMWYYNPRNETIEVEGVAELRSECVSVNNQMFHNSNPEIGRCPSCGSYEHTSELASIDDDGEELVCRECLSSFGRNLNRMCYSTDVLNHKGFGSTNTKINGEKVYVGLELEVYADFNDSNRKEVLVPINKFASSKKNTYCVATQDGSLSSSHGVEYIFRPEGLNQQKHNVHEFIRSIGDYLSEDAGDGYGLHIHVSSHFLSELDKVRIDNFIATFEKYFRHIGGRDRTEYQEAKNLNSNSQLKSSNHRKYNMLNISKPQTIEYRFPKSLVNEVHINMNLELALALTMFCKYNLSNIALNTKKCSPLALRKFIQYVAKNKKQYPLLNAENNANIDLNGLAKYHKRWSRDVQVHDAENCTYALCA